MTSIVFDFAEIKKNMHGDDWWKTDGRKDPGQPGEIYGPFKTDPVNSIPCTTAPVPPGQGGGARGAFDVSYAEKMLRYLDDTIIIEKKKLIEKCDRLRQELRPKIAQAHIEEEVEYFHRSTESLRAQRERIAQVIADMKLMEQPHVIPHAQLDSGLCQAPAHAGSYHSGPPQAHCAGGIGSYNTHDAEDANGPLRCLGTKEA